MRFAFEGKVYGEFLGLDKASSVVSVVRARTRIARDMAISMNSGITLLRKVGSPVRLDWQGKRGLGQF